MQTDYQTSRKTANILENPLQKAVRFLERRFDDEKGWSDFRTNSSGFSTSWITGYTLANIGELLDPNVVSRGLQIIQDARSADGSWGFSQSTPPDCDSTLCAIQALAQSMGHKELLSSVEYVLKHQLKNGGFATFIAKDSIDRYRARKRDESYAGWSSAHVCVSALALYLFTRFRNLQGEPANIGNLEAYIFARQKPEGYWSSYWWHSKHYATSLICRTWAKSRSPRTNLARNSALSWIEREARSGGFWTNGFDENCPCTNSTALSLIALIECGRSRTIVRNGLNWLTSKQGADGSWSGEPILRIPQPHLVDPDNWNNWNFGGHGTNSIAQDSKRILSTVNCLNALKYAYKSGIRA